MTAMAMREEQNRVGIPRGLLLDDLVVITKIQYDSDGATLYEYDGTLKNFVRNQSLMHTL